MSKQNQVPGEALELGEEGGRRSAIVTGGSSGIGAAIVERFLSSTVPEVRVAILDRQDPGLSSDRVLFVEADVSDDDSVRRAVQHVAKQWGGVDVVVNNAGIGAQGKAEDNSDQEWQRVFDINVVGAVRVVRHALPFLKSSSCARIVNMCSIAATAGLPERVLYSASKGAVLAMTRAMAADYITEGILVNCVNPGTTDTPWVSRLLSTAPDPEKERQALEARQPHGRLVAPQEVAEAVAFLALANNGSITGADIAVDGGMEGLRLRK